MEKLESWVDIPTNSDFSIYNLPYGIFSTPNHQKQVGVAIGDQILILDAVASLGLLDDLDIPKSVFTEGVLNPLIAQGKQKTNALRAKLIELLAVGNNSLKEHADKVLTPQKEAQMHLPVQVGDYTDFYSSIEHATNVGKMFRDPENALLPNWRHLPVGYHGRASSIVISGTPVYRPQGQMIPNNATQPVFGASRLLDFELEMAFVLGKNTELGQSISVNEAEDYIFGMVLFNDWSARDIQKWEYVPLGPFLAKSFASSVSPWIVTMEALDYFRVAGPKQEPEVLPYLQYEGQRNFDIQLEVALQPKDGEENTICRSNFKYMYWNICQQLAHHTVSGCNMTVGDMCASGTISGATPDSYGSMLELTWRGQNPLKLSDGTERKFIQDYDTVLMRGFAEKEGIRVGFGEVSGQLLPIK